MDEDMATWTRIETWARTWKHGREHGNMDEDKETWTRTWRHRRGHGDMDKDMGTGTRTWGHGDIDTWRRGDVETWILRHGH
jgi:hypothetical protein